MRSIAALADAACRLGLECERQAPMSGYTTFKIGGPAQLILRPQSVEQAALAIGLCRKAGEGWFILGRGSNLLVRDEGVRTPLIHIGAAMSAIRLEADGTVFCESGASLKSLCCFAQKNGLTGLEFAYGIPGSLGGAVYMNAGAYGGEMRNVVCEAEYIDEDGELKSLSGDDLAFGYRHSAFSGSRRCITGARLRLNKGDPAAISAAMEDFLCRRREKQPLEYPSAGSTFKRPQGGYASALIDSCGLKGLTVGGARVSEKHAGFVINAGAATCADVLALVEQIKARVLEQTGFTLECEILVVP